MSDLIFFNVADGYAESILRGFRKGFIPDDKYDAMKKEAELRKYKDVFNNIIIYNNI